MYIDLRTINDAARGARPVGRRRVPRASVRVKSQHPIRDLLSTTSRMH